MNNMIVGNTKKKKWKTIEEVLHVTEVDNMMMGQEVEIVEKILEVAKKTGKKVAAEIRWGRSIAEQDLNPNILQTEKIQNQKIEGH